MATFTIDDKIRRCQECNHALRQVEARDGKRSWICPQGCGEWRPDQKILSEREEVTVKYQGISRHKDPLPPGGPVAKGGGSKSGRKRKKPPNKGFRAKWEEV